MKGSQRYFRHVPLQRVNYCLFALAITLKDMSYESSQLKLKSNKMAEKKEKFGYQGQCKRRKKIRMGTCKRGLVDDFVELKRFRIRVIDST